MLFQLSFGDLTFQKTLTQSRLKPWWHHLPLYVTVILFLLQCSLKNWGEETFILAHDFISNFKNIFYGMYLYIDITVSPIPELT